MDNILNPTKLKEQYIKWLEDEITLNKINEYLEITSPFLDRYNDYLQVYAKMDNDNEILLTDDAYTLNNLKMAGVDINSPRRKQLLDNFLNKYKVQLDKEALTIKTGVEDFPQKLLFLMQTMLNVDTILWSEKDKKIDILSA